MFCLKKTQFFFVKFTHWKMVICSCFHSTVWRNNSHIKTHLPTVIVVKSRLFLCVGFVCCPDRLSHLVIDLLIICLNVPFPPPSNHKAGSSFKVNWLGFGSMSCYNHRKANRPLFFSLIPSLKIFLFHFGQIIMRSNGVTPACREESGFHDTFAIFLEINICMMSLNINKCGF